MLRAPDTLFGFLIINLNLSSYLLLMSGILYHYTMEEIKNENALLKNNDSVLLKNEDGLLENQKNEYITIDDFAKVEIKVGEVLSVDLIEGADKLYKLKVDLGESAPRQILSGIREYVVPEDLLGKQYPFVTNLAPRMLRGFESQGMILAGSDDNGLALLNPSKKLINGTRLK